MPELPEVETVRRGLEQAMTGERITRVEVRRGDLRWPLAQDFAARLEGKKVEGLGRRAKYLLADLSSGDVLVMHLGMSGSFRVVKGRGKTTPGRYYHERAKTAAHDHVVFHMSSGARIRQPLDACQYGDQRTATWYCPARVTRTRRSDSCSASSRGLPGPVTMACGRRTA